MHECHYHVNQKTKQRYYVSTLGFNVSTVCLDFFLCFFVVYIIPMGFYTLIRAQKNKTQVQRAV